MDVTDLVRDASKGDANAFVALTRRFQHLAFGSALALVRDFQTAEDITQEAFVAAWSALPKLADPAAFPGWLRGIVRHHAFRVLRRARRPSVDLAEAEKMPSEAPRADDILEARHLRAAVLAALAGLPTKLREPATLFYVHECSHQDIAVFLDLPVSTINNRLHAARAQLKQRMLTMVEKTLQSHGLPDDFANRIGRLLAARGSLVEVLFEPTSLPDLLSELLVSDEANKRAVAVQVIQRPGGGVVRGIAPVPLDGLQGGATVLNSGRQTETPLHQGGFEHVAPLLVAKGAALRGEGQLIETGIKVIDVMCPLAAGGTVAIAGEPGAGLVVLMEELVRRLREGSASVSLFLLTPPFSPEWPASMQDGFSLAGSLRQEGYSEGTVGAVQTFFLRGQKDRWTEDQLKAFNAADVVIHLSSEVAKAKFFPALDPRTCRSRLHENGLTDANHAAVASRVTEALAVLPWDGSKRPEGAASPIDVARAWKLMHFFTQPFLASERYTRTQGAHVSLCEAISGCDEIMQGRHDDLPLEAFYFGGSIAEIRDRAQRGGEGSKGGDELAGN